MIVERSINVKMTPDEITAIHKVIDICDRIAEVMTEIDEVFSLDEVDYENVSLTLNELCFSSDFKEMEQKIKARP